MSQQAHAHVSFCLCNARRNRNEICRIFKGTKQYAWGPKEGKHIPFSKKDKKTKKKTLQIKVNNSEGSAQVSFASKRQQKSKKIQTNNKLTRCSKQ
jgi:hypothetical protein